MRSRRLLLISAAASLLVVFGLTAGLRGRNREVRYQTAVVDRGDVVDVVGCTGTLQAVTTVQVGSQVSGTIQSLHADFNSVVKKDQVIARLDPSLFEARLGQARANLIAARANTERARSTVQDTRQKYQRAQELAGQNLLPQSELETAKANHDGAVAQLKASEAAVSQAEANVNQSQVDLAHTVIKTPIDGVVIARNVDVGQTVAASFQAPVLFVIANDMTRMQVNASIDEADIGRVKLGQQVSFRVDAYPDRTFPGRVEQVRLQPTTVQNVVSYNTIISVDNPELRLMPGMTATISIVVRRADNALRIPAAALRFRPEGFEPQRPGRGTASGPAAATGGSGAAGAASSERAQGAAAGGFRGGFGERGQRPEGAGLGPRAAAGGGERRGERGQGPADMRGGGEGARGSLIFVLSDKGVPEPRRVRLGISDGQFVEVTEGLEEGSRVVTGVDSGLAPAGPPRPGGSPSTNPFNPTPQFQQRRRG